MPDFSRFAHTDKDSLISVLALVIGFPIILLAGAIPSLVIASELDYTPIDSKVKYVEKMKNANLEIIKNSRHGVTMDQPIEFNKVVLNFMNS